jgi:hypothetical protein
MLLQKRGFVPIPEAVMGRLKQIHQPGIYQTGKASAQNSNNQ